MRLSRFVNFYNARSLTSVSSCTVFDVQIPSCRMGNNPFKIPDTLLDLLLLFLTLFVKYNVEI